MLTYCSTHPHLPFITHCFTIFVTRALQQLGNKRWWRITGLLLEKLISIRLIDGHTGSLYHFCLDMVKRNGHHVVSDSRCVGCPFLEARAREPDRKVIDCQVIDQYGSNDSQETRTQRAGKNSTQNFPGIAAIVAKRLASSARETYCDEVEKKLLKNECQGKLQQRQQRTSSSTDST